MSTENIPDPPLDPWLEYPELMKVNASLTEECQILRNTILGMLVKAGVVPAESANTPWGIEGLLRLAGMWINDELQWAAGSANHQKVLAALGRLEQRVGQLETNTTSIWQDVEGMKEKGGGPFGVKIVPLSHEGNENKSE